MRTRAVVEGDPGSEPGARFAPVSIVLEVDVLVLQRAPQPLDENVVEETTAPVYRDADASPFEGSGEGLARELAALDALLFVKR